MNKPSGGIPQEIYKAILQQHQLLSTANGWSCSCRKWKNADPSLFGEHQAEVLAKIGDPERNGTELLRHFYLMRDEDISGSSGMGKVAEAFVSENSKVALFWLVAPFSTQIYDSVDDLKKIHGHDGRTRLEPATDELLMTREERLDIGSRRPVE